MENKRYIISEASQKTGLEPHVLRYWEDELGLEIERNELGHRYYSEEQINLLCRVKEMKHRGFQLKAIKSELMGQAVAVSTGVVPSLPQQVMTQQLSVQSSSQIATQVVQQSAAEIAHPALQQPLQQPQTVSENKMDQFKAIIAGIVAETLRENNVILGQELSDTVGNKVIKEMDYLLRMKEEAEEDRFKKLDEAIRSCQRSNKEVAVGKEKRVGKRFFRRK